MTGMWMLYASAVGLLLGAAAAALDPLLRGRALPTRPLWALAIAATLALPITSLVRPTPAGPAGAQHAEVTPTTTAGPQWRIVHAATTRISRALGVVDPYLVPAWLAASMLLALGLGGGMLRLRARARVWPGARIAGHDVLLSDGFGPALVGAVHPRIVMPRWMLGLDGERVRLAVWHEEEHRAAGDVRLLLAGVLAVVAAPWNPALWWQLRRLRGAVELDCDGRVLRRGAHPVLYGSLLFELGTGAAATPLPAAALVPSPSLLERRLIMITRGTNRKGRITTAALVAGAVLAVAAACEADPPVEPQAAEIVPAEAALTEAVGLATSGSSKAIRLSDSGPDGPLVYVDEIRVRNDVLDDLDPNTIDRIEVIKGDAARALFGDAASNGVIQIFTKPQG